MEEPERPRMLRACYLYALYSELCHQRGEVEGKVMCGKILRVRSTTADEKKNFNRPDVFQVLDMLIPLNELYNKDAASKILEGK